ncbi:42646_t:CDS:1, partial [Gigaspora margarita]
YVKLRDDLLNRYKNDEILRRNHNLQHNYINIELVKYLMKTRSFKSAQKLLNEIDRDHTDQHILEKITKLILELNNKKNKKITKSASLTSRFNKKIKDLSILSN